MTGIFVDASGATIVAGETGVERDPSSGYVSKVAPDGSSLLWSANLSVNFGERTGIIKSVFMAPELIPGPPGVPAYTGNLDLFGSYAPIIGPSTGSEPYLLGTPGLFAAQLKPDGSGFNYSVDLGQSRDAHAAGIAVDPSGSAYLAGTSSASQLAPVAGAPNLGPDFVLALDPSGTRLRPPLHFPRGVINVLTGLSTTEGLGLMLLGAQTSLLTVPVNYQLDSPAIVAWANSASLALNTGVFPGALLTLFGFDLPSSPQDVQVLIGGMTAPLLFVGPTQINLRVPFETTDSAQLQIVLASGNISIPLAFIRSLGIFTTDGIHAAALNQDGTVNSADNPAPASSVVSLFGTGAVWSPDMQDGAIASSATPLNQQQNNLGALDWNGDLMNILYAGTAPGTINGVFQVNVQLPPTTPQGGVLPELMLQSPAPNYPNLPNAAVYPSRSGNAVQVYVK